MYFIICSLNKSKNAIIKKSTKLSFQSKNASIRNVYTNIFETEEDDDEEPYLDEDEVRDHIKELLTDKISTKLYFWFHKNSASYKSIDDENKTDYDIETIKGKTEIKSIIENDIDRALDILKLDNLDKNFL